MFSSHDWLGVFQPVWCDLCLCCNYFTLVSVYCKTITRSRQQWWSWYLPAKLTLSTIVLHSCNNHRHTFRCYSNPTAFYLPSMEHWVGSCFLDERAIIFFDVTDLARRHWWRQLTFTWQFLYPFIACEFLVDVICTVPMQRKHFRIAEGSLQPWWPLLG